MREDFAIFILSHERADNIKTLKMLEEAGYTGRWYIVVDDEDRQLERYKELYKDKVLVFSKDEVAKTIDVGDNFDFKSAIVYARNVCFDLAEQLGLKYFLELDDDYDLLMYRYSRYGVLKAAKVNNFDELCEAMLNFLDVSGAHAVCLGQGGDFIAGAKTGLWKQGFSRKAMNTYFMRTDRRFKFVGKLNEDVCTYTWLGSRGYLFLTIPFAMVKPAGTQSMKGGISELYKKVGTYVKTFYAVMYMPSAVKVAVMTTSHARVHHKVYWENCVPQILSEKWKKGGK